jgi:hypothetical protein
MDTIERNDEPILEAPPRVDDPCTACGFPSVMTISMSFEETLVTVQVCIECDKRTWNRDGESVSLEGLFSAMRTTSKRH